MRALRIPLFLALAAGLASPALAHGWGYRETGSMVGVSVSVGDASAPLLAARDGSGRFYFEARAGESYEVTLTNRTSERLGVALIVDGLNSISGTRQAASAPGRMYVLGPWEDTTVRGWRSSLSDIRRFTFVDERASYAARSGKANSKMGWVEVAVFRERRPYVARPYWSEPRESWPEAERRSRDDGAAKSAPAPPATAAPESKSRDEAADAVRGLGYTEGRSYPGTGWGSSAYDPVEVVAFDPLPYAAETITLRYEYAPALRALGLLPPPAWSRDRLRERDGGFAAPPAW